MFVFFRVCFYMYLLSKTCFEKSFKNKLDKGMNKRERLGVRQWKLRGKVRIEGGGGGGVKKTVGKVYYFNHRPCIWSWDRVRVFRA